MSRLDKHIIRKMPPTSHRNDITLLDVHADVTRLILLTYRRSSAGTTGIDLFGLSSHVVVYIVHCCDDPDQEGALVLGQAQV